MINQLKDGNDLEMALPGVMSSAAAKRLVSYVHENYSVERPSASVPFKLINE